MKKCEYCAKEISYFEQYCSDECQTSANKFYELREKFEHFFSVLNGICIFGIPIGFFIFSFMKTAGMVVTVASFIILGIMIIILPFPTENMISKYKLKKSIKITRFVGLISILLGIVSFLFMFFFSA